MKRSSDSTTPFRCLQIFSRQTNVINFENHWTIEFEYHKIQCTIFCCCWFKSVLKWIFILNEYLCRNTTHSISKLSYNIMNFAYSSKEGQKIETLRSFERQQFILFLCFTEKRTENLFDVEQKVPNGINTKCNITKICCRWKIFNGLSNATQAERKH